MAYATVPQLLDRKDYRTIGDLVSDDGSPVSEVALANNAKVAAALADASGMVDAALLAGSRYTTAQLSALTGNSQAYLIRIVCDITVALLYDRRPLYDVDGFEKAMKLSEAHLERLRKGEHVFDVEEVKAAGVPDTIAPSVIEVDRLNLIRDRTQNYYPARRASWIS